ncbi:hypothetical protein NPIL_216141 [Nephila pilipes]|uniref:Uncharacterized protein n=1 Tax=Nephila pilipes TaxID=299642 RepID=A0A8X6NF03_NEPPI|nr:hypothetical protein NPIL_216141 [Nephila pilipes]
MEGLVQNAVSPMEAKRESYARQHVKPLGEKTCEVRCHMDKGSLIFRPDGQKRIGSSHHFSQWETTMFVYRQDFLPLQRRQ